MKRAGWIVVAALSACSKSQTPPNGVPAKTSSPAAPAPASSPQVKDLEARGLAASDKTERLAAVVALGATKSEEGLDALGRLYAAWAPDRSTGEARLKILEVYADAADKDPAGAEKRILAAMLVEKGGIESMQTVNKAGFDLWIHCWKNDPSRVAAARQRLFASPSPAEQFAIMVGLVTGRVKDLAPDLVKLYESSKDRYLRANLVNYGATLGDAKSTFEMYGDAIDRPLSEDDHIYFTCAIGALGNLVERDPSVRADAARMLVELAKRKDMDAYVLRTIVDALGRMEPSALAELSAPGTFTDPELAKIVADASQKANGSEPK